MDNDCDGRTDMADSFCDPAACSPPAPATAVAEDGSYRAAWRETTDWADTFSLWSCMHMGPMIPAHQASSG